jgi:hypothetical protein
VDAKQMTLFVLFLEPHGSGKPVTLFYDNVRLARESTSSRSSGSGR